MPSGVGELEHAVDVKSILEAYSHQLKKKTYALLEISLISRGDSSGIPKKELWTELDMMQLNERLRKM